MSSRLIETDSFSVKLREKAIDLRNKKILITNYHGSEQEQDLTEPANCNGFGRIRHFKLKSSSHWPINPLPILPAARALGTDITSEIRAQVFQNAICNWRCWYCFVDFKLLSGNKNFSHFLSTDELIDLYLKQEDPPSVIDLTGGQPDLTPEWVPWMMETIYARHLEGKIFLWSDDNLSNDYFWRYLSPQQIDTIINYKLYGRVCCFKGIDEESFSVNTKAKPDLFSRQFELFKRIYDLNLNLYAYITLTSALNTDYERSVPNFFDRIQKINENLILRIVPLEVFAFSPVQSRLSDVEKDLMEGQYKAIEIWTSELNKRFSADLLKKDITEINIY
jgi:uncharacterized Fe-S cluster-containing radical SAM superfamily protein